jgi:hypothetical protein
MSRASKPAETPRQPTLADLMGRFLERQASAHASGLTTGGLSGEVVPFEAAPVQPVEPRLAWEGALAALGYFHPDTKTQSGPVPLDWPSLVTAYEPVVAVALCAGNFPQMVRNLYPLMHEASLSNLRNAPVRPAGLPALLTWADEQARKNEHPQTLVAVGVLRLAQESERAAELLASCQVPADWRAAWANEQAALAWHRGQVEKAAASWQAQETSVPVLFNRGMAALFLDRPAESRTWLTQAVEQIPEDDAWHHLGRLYLALAEMRGGQ